MLVTKQLDLEDHNGQFVAASTDGSGCVAFFVVGGFVSVSAGVYGSSPRRAKWVAHPLHNCSCAVGMGMPNYNEPLMIRATIPPFYKNGSTFQFLELKEEVKKDGCVHDCSHHGNCSYNVDGKVVLHSTTGSDGGRFFLLPRFAAYPPRRS